MKPSAQVLIVTPDIVGPVKNGGIGTACFHYARTLANAGVTVAILFTGEASIEAAAHWAAWYRNFGIEFLTMGDVPPLDKSTFGCTWYTERSLRIHNFLLDRTHQYVIFQDWHGNGFWTARAKRMGVFRPDTCIGVITHSPNEWQREGMEHHGDEPFERADMEWIERETIAAADIIVSPSQHMINWLRQHGYALPQTVVRCPITFEDELAVALPGTCDLDHIIFFGRLETRKGLHLLAAALLDMDSHGHPMPRRLSLLGKNALVDGQPTGVFLADLQRKLPEIEFFVENDFTYVEAVNYIKDAKGLVVLPSMLDNFPLTVVESITNRFFFIASAVGGIPEIIDPSLTFEPSQQGLAAKLVGRHGIKWKDLRHPYDPAGARETWLAHVRGVLRRREPTPAQDLRIALAPAVARRAPPPVSVCVPFYRHDAFLGRMITAFLRAPEPEIQLVVVNDGTPDGETREFNRFAELLAPAGHVFHSQTNAGPGAARNEAVRLAAHEHILFFDADNVPFPRMAGRLLEALQTSGADSISAPFAAVPAMSAMPREADVWFHYVPPGGSAVRSLVDNQLGDMTCMMHRKVFEGVGGFNLERRSWEDWEFFLRLVLKGYRHMVYSKPLLFYTFDPEGRNESARHYHNRLSLLKSLHGAPEERVIDMLSVFVRDHLNRINKQ